MELCFNQKAVGYIGAISFYFFLFFLLFAMTRCTYCEPAEQTHNLSVELNGVNCLLE